ncbi:MAG TPA: hypothetical protein VEC19_11245 [Usitatibacter sp.]|nr:hypothetical protein [Usitatibacter sp.]
MKPLQVLAFALLAASTGALAQQAAPHEPASQPREAQPQSEPQPQPQAATSANTPRIPHGNEMGFFRPQSDPALTRFAPPAETAAASGNGQAQAPIPVPPLEERLKWAESQMDRAESEHALGKEQLNQYAPPGSPGFPGLTEERTR